MSAPSAADTLGPVILDLECRTAPDALSGARHPVVIAPDWTVRTPHDLAAERLARALGGYCSCVDLVDRTLPAVRASLPLLRRQDHVELESSARRAWTLRRRASCCPSASPSIAHAVRHARSADHIATTHDAPAWQVTDVLEQVGHVDGPWVSPPEPTRTVPELGHVQHLRQLWDAGIHPDELHDLAAVVGIDEPLPVEYFLALTYGRTDRAFLSAVARWCHDPDLLAWLAWREDPGGKAPARVWAGWILLGVPRWQIVLIVDSRVRPEHVRTAAAALGRPARFVAADVVGWITRGCFPTLDHLRELEALGLSQNHPTDSALTDVCVAAANLVVGTSDPRCPDRTELGVLLAMTGSISTTLELIRRGVRAVSDLPPGDPLAVLDTQEHA